MNPQTTERSKGFMATIITVVVIILIALVGLGVYAYKHPSNMTMTNDSNTSTTTTSTVSENPTTTSSTVVTTSPDTYTEVNPFPGGTVYHNAAYRLTLALPAGYTYAESIQEFQGMSDSDTITFSNIGQTIFSINAFTKSQWNTIRTQENLAHQNVNDLGEGNYYGENTNFIFSSTISNQPTQVQSILDAGRFY
jgi:cytoskeletal protein RodZ